MDKIDMLDKIYKVMDGHEERVSYNYRKKVIRFGDILDYIDSNCFYEETEGSKKYGGRERNMDKLTQCLHSLFYLFLGRHGGTIEEQKNECIKYVYDLLQQTSIDG